MSKHYKKKITILWHDIICERSRDGEMYQCTHCEEWFPRNMVCGDHYYPKSTHPELRYDITNGQTSCMACNQKGSAAQQRKAKEQQLPPSLL